MKREDEQPGPEQEDRNGGLSVAGSRAERHDGNKSASAPIKGRRRDAWAFWRQLTGEATGLGLETDELYWDTHGLLWIGFSFAAGIALYGVLPEEPYWPFLLICCGFLTAAAFWRSVHRSPGKLLLLLLALFCGMTAAAVRTASLDAPRLSEPLNADLTGTVVRVEENASGQRLLLEVATVNGADRGRVTFPERVRIQVRGSTGVRTGERIAIRTRLFPPPGPVSPGGYDFAFRAYFDRIGGTGFSYGPAEALEGAKPSIGIRAAAAIEDVRGVLAGRIKESLAGKPEASLAVALLVGDRSGITEELEEDLRAAGLAHILAISGLHMALFAGGAFSATLLLLALIPGASLRWPIHKWAALAALGSATAYLVISGAAVATQRSFLMIALVFLGILLGRRGLTLRSVALAGLFLLMLAPERLFLPGFQMSFAAVICLVAVYGLWRQRERLAVRKERTSGLPGRVGRFLGKWVLGLTVTAVVAGVATGIIGANHFARIAPYGLLGNLLGMPVFTLIVMPMGVLAMMLLPFGLAALPLSLMAVGLSLLQDIAAFTARLGDGAGAVGRLAAGAGVMFIAALFFGLLLPARWRFAALVPLVAGIALASISRPPDILVAASGTQVAARDEDGVLRFSGSRRSFSGDLWLQDEGVPQGAIQSHKMKSHQKTCGELGCVVLAHGKSDESRSLPALAIALPKVAEALILDCRYGDIIVSDLSVSESCSAGLVLDREMRARRGAVSIWLEADPVGGANRTADGSIQGLGSESIGGGEGGRAEADGTPGHRNLARVAIKEIRYAIPDPPRPWHRQGTVTYDSLPRRQRTAD